MKVSNKNAYQYINNLEAFHASNLYGEWRGNTYVVFSYGEHFPIYIWDDVVYKWIGNMDKYSHSTTRHQSLAKPHYVHRWVDTEGLKSMIRDGIVGYCINQAQT
jgi:hypothetical protein